MMSTIAKGEINSAVNAALLKVAVIEVVTDAKREVVAAKTGLRGNYIFNRTNQPFDHPRTSYY